ncbi:hypothetical protein OR263_30025 [Streptomyces sp. NEAU-H22]|uniref:hypothetical protein n=1 Tax=unclassified Streptomyces TaxID=2593676 RepID=UPI002258977C|nr:MULTISPECIES: hypothetical protein [unclassified Streptomyces]MCX3290896.1 hypothetical protein [Streptomyces sp. NEAU-H22]WMD07875.1 hypothetical protein Q7C01_27500 [Streptomyces sp. FXY-T5]
MSAPTHTRSHPATSAGVAGRLPWWALALPVLAFAALLALILNPSDAHAATGDPGITRLLERAQELMAR